MPKGIKGFQKGHTINLGSKRLLETRKKMSITKLKNPIRYWLGKKRSNKLKKKISQAIKKRYSEGNKFGFQKGHSSYHTEESRQKIREARINQKMVFRNTGIELKMEAELQKRNINYQKQVPLCKIAIVDFYLPEHKIVIQCDGDYWHNLPDHKERDEKQDAILTFNEFNVFRFWEHEINQSVEDCVNKVNIK